jgi:TATA-box binding protein (TBP) (component of TFIID and TFIIIB)
MDAIPNNVTISTITVNCNLNTLMLLDNISNYMPIDLENIIAIKSGKYNILRCIDNQQDKFKSINKNYKKNFYNQLTIIIKVSEDKYINIKLFKNGSIQMTGCKSLIDINIAINKLINKLKLNISIDDNIITFIDNIENIKVISFKIDLINSNFGINYKINREQLYNILIKQNILCRISSIHACINIKYKIISNDNITYISIFIFQTGNIIIIAKNPEHIKLAYIYIVDFLNKNKQNIIKKNINDYFDSEYIKKFLQSVKEQ